MIRSLQSPDVFAMGCHSEGDGLRCSVVFARDPIEGVIRLLDRDSDSRIQVRIPLIKSMARDVFLELIDADL